jgi:hypothetical protein
MRTDEKNTPRSQSNAGDMEQKDHILRLARGVKTKDQGIDELLALLTIYVDADDDTILDTQPLLGYWSLGGTRKHRE